MVAWAPRIQPLLYTLAPTSNCPLLIDPGPDTDLGRRALAGQWHYALEPGTAEDPRSMPAKKERVFADVGDALAYGVALLLSLAKTMRVAQAVALSVLIQTQSGLNAHSPAPPAPTVALPL